MELRQLRYFLAAYEAGSVTAAARACRIAQPSVSQALLDLETELGARLFERSRRGLWPTETAHALAISARRLLSDAAAMKALASGQSHAATRLTIFLHATLASHRIVRLLSTLGADPTLDLRVALDAVQADIAIVPLLEGGDGEELWSEDYLLCLPRSHPLAAQDRLRLADLFGIRLIARCSCERPTALPREQLRPEIVAVAAEEDRVLALVAAGLGAAIVPGASAEIPGIAVRRLEDFSLRRTIVARFRPHVPPIVRARLVMPFDKS